MRSHFLKLITTAALLFVSQSLSAADTTVIVWPGNTGGWSYTNFGTDADQAFVPGPGIPPSGDGSSGFWHAGPPGYNGGTLHTANLNGVYLRDVVELTYWTYQAGAEALLYQPPYVQIFLDLDDDGLVDDGIGFEPSWQSGGRFMLTGLQETPFVTSPNLNVEQNNLGSTAAGVAANQWWQWDLLIGSWWGRGGMLSTGTYQLGRYECFNQGCVTLEGIVEAYPDARIISQAGATGTGGVRLQYGFGGNSQDYVGHVDQLVVGLTTGDRVIYDFEPGPQDKDDCKKGGWQGFFRNQGQCVSYFERTIPD